VTFSFRVSAKKKKKLEKKTGNATRRRSRGNPPVGETLARR
jgi:hypothetical protein